MLKKRIIVTMMISVMLVLSLGITAIASGSLSNNFSSMLCVLTYLN